MTGSPGGVAADGCLPEFAMAGLTARSADCLTGSRDFSMFCMFVFGDALTLTVGEQPITQVFPDLIAENRDDNDDHDDGKQTVYVSTAF